ncbi:MAG: glycosyltransferase [Calditrichaeota bacterium]|nr:glycosyltransferase [Calditrichota bacterium]
MGGIFWIGSVLALWMGLGRVARRTEESKPLNEWTPAGELPSISVLVAARNEEKNIRKLLEALQLQDYPKERWETIILDDSSSDNTVGIVHEYFDQRQRLQLIKVGIPPNGVAPKKNALIKGMSVAAGEIILVTDADCVPGPGWVSGIARQFSAGIDAVVGYSPLSGDGVTGAVGKFDAFVNAVVSAGSIGLGHPTTAVGRNFSYRKTAWDAVGGFGSTLEGASGDDDLMLQRIAANGGHIVFSTDRSTVIRSNTKSTLGDWWRMKRRHLSAGKRYQPKLVLFSSALYIFQIGLLILAGLATFGKISPIHVIAIWGFKVFADWLTLHRGARLLHHRNWIGAFLTGEVISPILFAVLVPISLVGKVRWKGRALNN